VLLLVLFVVAYLTRAQAVALLPAFLTAPLLLGRRTLRDYRVLYGAVAAAVVVVLAVQLGRGASPLGVFGAYSVAGSSHYGVASVSRWFLYHVAELDLSLGVLPFAALVVLVAVSRRLDRGARVFAAAAVSLSFWLVLEVATFASEQSLRVEERNMFYLAPLFLIALLVWIERGLPRPRAAAAAVLVAAALPGALPYASLIGLPAVSDSPALLPLWSISDAWFNVSELPGVVVLCCVAAGLLFLFVSRRVALVLLPVLLLVYFGVSMKPIEGKYRTASIGALFAGITAPQRDWIDRAVGHDAHVVALWTGATDPHAIWDNEFFSRSVGVVYDIGPPLPGGMPETKLHVDPATGLMSAHGRPVRTPYALTDGSVAVAGVIVAADEHKGMLLYRVDGPLRQTTRVKGLYAQDTWSGPHVTYTRYGCGGGSLTVTLQSDAALFTRPQTVVGRGARTVAVRVPPTEPRTLRVPLGADCTARFTVTPTAIPAVVTQGANPDPRVLGIHFSAFEYKP
jgi:hypothetical protein